VAFLLLAVLALGLAVWIGMWPSLVERRRNAVRARPFPDAWREILRWRVPYFRRLPADLQLALKQHIQVFLDEKSFVGCGGLEINDVIRVTIAAQACLLLLNRKTDYYPGLHEILVYPAAFEVPTRQVDASGLVTEKKEGRVGESWARGQVVLSWHDTVEGAAAHEDGHNVVLHEFAHQLDQETGSANGAPILPSRRRYREWSSVFNAGYAQLQARLGVGEPSVLRAYAATSPGEFFAVATEVFFEQPAGLLQEYPALYEQLARYYRLDPLSW